MPTVIRFGLTFISYSMRSRVQLGAGVGAVAAFLLIGTFFMWTPDTGDRCARTEEPVYTKPLYIRSIDNTGRESRQTITLQDTLKYERDKLSQELNKLKMKIGRMDCEVC